MEIKTIGDLKRAIEEYQRETGQDDNTSLRVPVQAYTQAWPAGYFQITQVTGGAGHLCLYVNMPKGFSISKLKRIQY